MCRSSLPTTSAARRMSSSGASSPTCCRSTQRARRAKTLGFHLSARFPFSDVVVTARERRGHPLVAVRQSDLRRSRPLPRLPWHRNRPDRAAPFRAGDHEARAVRFAHRPAQPGDDAADARRGAAQRDEPAEGLRALPDRPRPLQERQRYARPSGRRRAPPPGRRPPEVGDGRPWAGRAPGRRRVQGRASGHGRHRPAGIAGAHADRAGVAALQHRRPPRSDRRVSRRRHRRPRPLHRRQPCSRRRSRSLRGEGRRPRQALLLRAGHAHRGVRSPGPRERPSPGHRQGRAVGRLPADHRGRQRGGVAASKRSCAGIIRCAAGSRPTSSSRSPKNAA